MLSYWGRWACFFPIDVQLWKIHHTLICTISIATVLCVREFLQDYHSPALPYVEYYKSKSTTCKDPEVIQLEVAPVFREPFLL
jgi:hypothetical protein